MQTMQNLSNPMSFRPNTTDISSKLQSAKLLSNQSQTPSAGMANDSSFASALNSHQHVSAMMQVSENSAFGPTLSERGGVIDAENGTITFEGGIPSSIQVPTQSATPPPQEIRRGKPLKHEAMELSQGNQGMPLNGGGKKTFRNTRIMPLDQNSLNTLDRLAKRKEENNPIQNLQIKKHSREELTKDLINTFENKITNANSLGQLSAKYESSHKGSSVIGYDRNGGTSYGTYQLSSKQGSFDEFLNFLDENEPNWAEKLRQSGDANTGSRTGKTPDMWKQLSEENPERMKKLEHDYIVNTYYEPAANHLENKLGKDASPAMQEVIFSTAVQHGVSGAKNLFNQALADMKLDSQKEKTSLTASMTYDKELIQNIYSQRKTKFGSSSDAIQESARNRFVREERDALAMLG